MGKLHTPLIHSVRFTKLDEGPNDVYYQPHLVDEGVPLLATRENVARVCECWNALAGCPNPQEAIPKMREALEYLLNSVSDDEAWEDAQRFAREALAMWEGK